MRSRYSTYTMANIDYIKETMRGNALAGFQELDAKRWAKRVTWIKLNVLKSVTESLSLGYVEFEAESSKSVPTQFGIWRGLVCHKPNGKMIIVNHLTTLEDSVCHSIDRYEHVDGSQIIQTKIETFNVRLYDDSSFLINMLKTVGFREIRMMNPFDKKSAPNIDATAVVYECRK